MTSTAVAAPERQDSKVISRSVGYGRKAGMELCEGPKVKPLCGCEQQYYWTKSLRGRGQSHVTYFLNFGTAP